MAAAAAVAPPAAAPAAQAVGAGAASPSAPPKVPDPHTRRQHCVGVRVDTRPEETGRSTPPSLVSRSRRLGCDARKWARKNHHRGLSVADLARPARRSSACRWARAAFAMARRRRARRFGRGRVWWSYRAVMVQCSFCRLGCTCSPLKRGNQVPCHGISVPACSRTCSRQRAQGFRAAVPRSVPRALATCSATCSRLIGGSCGSGWRLKARCRAHLRRAP